VPARAGYRSRHQLARALAPLCADRDENAVAAMLLKLDDDGEAVIAHYAAKAGAEGIRTDGHRFQGLMQGEQQSGRAMSGPNRATRPLTAVAPGSTTALGFNADDVQPRGQSARLRPQRSALMHWWPISVGAGASGDQSGFGGEQIAVERCRPNVVHLRNGDRGGLKR
jgi:hypothetical protein